MVNNGMVGKRDCERFENVALVVKIISSFAVEEAFESEDARSRLGIRNSLRMQARLVLLIRDCPCLRIAYPLSKCCPKDLPHGAGAQQIRLRIENQRCINLDERHLDRVLLCLC